MSAHARPSNSALAQNARAQRTRQAKTQRQLVTPPTTPQSNAGVRLSMPRELPRPVLQPVCADALAAIDPELSGIPVEFVRQSVLAMSKSICDAMAAVAPKSLPTSPLPPTLECVVRDQSVEPSDLPTHFLIVHDPRASKQRGLLFPAHSLVLACQCSALASFGPTRRELSDDNTALTVPLVSCAVPAPSAFGILNTYLYTHNVQQLMAALLPLPGAALASLSHESVGMTARLACTMAKWHTIRALLSMLKTLHGVWANATTLGFADDQLWTIMSFAWTVLTSAIERSAGVAPHKLRTDDQEPNHVDQEHGDASLPYEAQTESRP